MNAKEARKRALDKSLVMFNDIMEQINSHVWVGRLECRIYMGIDDENMKKLIDLGYEVIKNDGLDNYLIKW